MYRVYEFEPAKKADITKLLEADPYAEDSFARVGYKIKDGLVLEEDKTKCFIFIRSSEDFIKKADEKLKGLAVIAKPDVEKRVSDKIIAEEEAAENGLGSIFGE